MPNVQLNQTFIEIHGAMGDIVFHMTGKGQVIIQSPPDISKTEWSEAQFIQQEHIEQANAYARAAMADPQTRAIDDEMAIQGDKPPYRVAFCDYFKGNNLLSKR